MGNSRNRDIYEAKLRNSAQGDPEKMMEGLARSPHRAHKRRAERVLKLAMAFDQLKQINEGEKPQ